MLHAGSQQAMALHKTVGMLIRNELIMHERPRLVLLRWGHIAFWGKLPNMLLQGLQQTAHILLQQLLLLWYLAAPFCRCRTA